MTLNVISNLVQALHLRRKDYVSFDSLNGSGAIIGDTPSSCTHGDSSKFMLPIMKCIGPIVGMAGPISEAGKRYLDAANYADDVSGKFFASSPNKFVGKLEEQRTALLQNITMLEEGYDLIVELGQLGLRPIL